MRYIPRGERGAQQPSSSSSQRENPVKLLKRDVATHHGSHKLQQTLLRFRPQQLRVNRAAVLNPKLRGHLQLHASHILATERAKRKLC